MPLEFAFQTISMILKRLPKVCTFCELPFASLTIVTLNSIPEMILKSIASPLVIQATPHFGTLSSFVTNTFQPLSHPVYTAFKMVGFNCKSNPVVNPSIQDFPGGPVVRTRLFYFQGWVWSSCVAPPKTKPNETKQKHSEKWSPVSEFKHPFKWLCIQMFEKLFYLEGNFAIFSPNSHFISEGWRLSEVV